MRGHGDFFDHNLHALRIVEDFEQRYAGFRGLNLTFEVREGIIKHSHDYSVAVFPQLAEYLLDQRPPLEAQLIDLTDEIAYDTADLDDGYEARILTLEQIRAGVPVFEPFFREAERTYPEVPDKLKFNEALKGMLNRLVTDLITNTGCRLRSAGIASVEAVRAHPQRLAAFSTEVDKERRQAKEFLYQNLYYSSELGPEKVDAERVVSELFDYWMRNPSALPGNYREKASSEPLQRVVCDYIAGMTDPYILQQHEKFCQ
jgi:dGTPase